MADADTPGPPNTLPLPLSMSMSMPLTSVNVNSGVSNWVTIGSHNLQKRINDVSPLSSNKCKPPAYNYYVMLESESSVSSDDGSESVYSVQNKETDVAKDTSDTEWTSRDSDDDSFTTEFDVVTDVEQPFIDSHNSGSSEEEVITSVFRTILNNVELLSADSEDSMSASSTTSETPRSYYQNCAQCLSSNDNPMFRYCYKCYKVRKDFFPPRPKRFRKKKGHIKQNKERQVKNENILTNLQTYISSQCQGTLLEKDECNGPKSQLCLDFKNIKVPGIVNNISLECERNENKLENDSVNATFVDECLNVHETRGIKRAHEEDVDESVSLKKIRSNLDETEENVNNKSIVLSENFETQRFLGINVDNESDDVSFSQPMFSNEECKVQTITKATSDPGVHISSDDIDLHKLPNRSLTDIEDDSVSLRESKLSDDDGSDKKESKSDSDSEKCITCLIEPKSGVFVHGRIAHICCCYKCSIQVWVKTKKCPICNCRVSNVLRAFRY